MHAPLARRYIPQDTVIWMRASVRNAVGSKRLKKTAETRVGVSKTEVGGTSRRGAGDLVTHR